MAASPRLMARCKTHVIEHCGVAVSPLTTLKMSNAPKISFSRRKPPLKSSFKTLDFSTYESSSWLQGAFVLSCGDERSRAGKKFGVSVLSYRLQAQEMHMKQAKPNRFMTADAAVRRNGIDVRFQPYFSIMTVFELIVISIVTVTCDTTVMDGQGHADVQAGLTCLDVRVRGRFLSFAVLQG
jgi:hypothetical protein